MAFDERQSAPEKAPADPPAARRVPREPSDAFGAPVLSRRSPFGSDLVEEWQQQALVLAREQQREVSGERSIRLRVTPGFVLVAALAGAGWGVSGALVSLIAFLSAGLLQQLPGAWWTLRGGKSVRITVSALGDELEPSAFGWRRAAQVLLGSLVNLALASGVWLAFRSKGHPASVTPVAEVVAATHGAWAIGQALPLVPFQLGRALARRLTRASQLALAVVSFATLAGFGTLLLLRAELSPFLPVLVAAGVAAAGEARRAALRLREGSTDLVSLIERAEQGLAHDDPARALQLAQSALQVAELETSRARLHCLVAWAAIGKGDPFLAHGAMQRLPGNRLTIELVAAYLACCNRNEEAIKLLRDARTLGHRARETSKLQIELLAKLGARKDAAEIAAEDRRLLTLSDLHALERAGIG